MNFNKSKNMLLQIFNKNNFENHVRNNNTHEFEKVLVTFSNGTEISISFPGYKAIIGRYGVVYDYRVDIKKNNIKTSLSHANIITDIFNKIEYGGMDANTLKEILIGVAKEGEIDIDSIKSKLPYNPTAPKQNLLSRVRNAHGNKAYNIDGNSFDLTIEELISSIKWIVLQEDINYPIEREFEGRKMPFSRYLETIHITQFESHSLEEVINRALSHTRPIAWNDMDYTFTNLIN